MSTQTTTAFRVMPLDPALVRRMRGGGVDVRGAEATVRRDASPHQCRSCLRLTAPDEEYLLFSHRPFTLDSAYAEVGPIFIHRRECEPYAPGAGYPAEMPRKTATLRAYGETDQIVDAEVVTDGDTDSAIDRLLADPQVAYLHARNADWGCYIFRIERA